MSCSKRTQKFICFFDTYANSFQVQFRYKSSFQTNFGGLISTILLLLLLAALIFLYIYLESRDEQRIVTFNQRYNDPPEFTMTSNFSNITYSTEKTSQGFFFASIYFFDKVTNKPILLEDLSKEINVLFRDITFGDDNEIPLEMAKCRELYPNITDRFPNHPNLADSYCFKKDLTVKGDFISETYHYVLMRLSRKTAANEGTTETVVDASATINKLKVTMYISDYTINNTIKTDTPITYMIKPIEIELFDNKQYDSNMYISFNQFISNDNIYAPWDTKKLHNCFKITKMKPIYLPLDSKNIRIMSVYLRSAYQYDRYQRNFKSFFDLLCQLGGLWKVLLFIGAIIVVPINLSLMNVSISNKMFNMVHPHNEADVQMTYEQYSAKEEEYNQVPEIFKSLNPVLKRMSIEYYRYERNKGMDFTLKEALSKMFCCCCNIKTLQGKDMIFKSSGKEIEKRLDTVTVARFAQELKAMKRVFLGNYASLLNYNNNTNIDYSSLGRIRQEFNEQYAFSTAKPISIVYHKQTNLVSAFNILRNQGDLTKIDLLMIKLFQLDPELVLKFFITYSDRFELIYPSLFRSKRTQQKLRDVKEEEDEYNDSETSNEKQNPAKGWR